MAEEPTITLPLSQFLDILWSYKKGSELRDRAVPGPEIVAALESQCPDPEGKYYVIQKTGLETGVQPIVWQPGEWKTSGVPKMIRTVELKKRWGGIDSVIETLAPKFPMLTKDMLRALADDLIQKKDWSSLQAFGVNTEGME